MAHLARLMQEVEFSRGHEASALLDCEQGERYGRIALFGNEEYLLGYLYRARRITLREGCLEGTVEVYWMNPLTGVRSYAGETDFRERRSFLSPAKEYMPNQDWVLILRRKRCNG